MAKTAKTTKKPVKAATRKPAKKTVKATASVKRAGSARRKTKTKTR